MTEAVTETVERLLDDAFSVLQHDADETQAPEKYEREALRRKFTARLKGVAGLAQCLDLPTREEIAQAICGASGNGFLVDCSPARHAAYLLQADAVLELFAASPDTSTDREGK